MFSGEEMVRCLRDMGITHVLWVPDSTLGTWEEALRQAEDIQLVAVCREGEAWSAAAGLHLGGARPLVMIQCTGLFESGDALRNAVYDYGLPLFAVVGYRSYLNQADDSARIFTEPIINAWGLDSVLIDEPDKLNLLKEHYRACRETGRAGVALLGESRG